jgi:hypothetical protein
MKKFNSLDFKHAIEIFNEIKKIDNDFLINELLESIVKYARIRTDWYFMTDEERKEGDKSRTITHNALISNINAISRNMAKSGHDISWREELTDNRKVIGDWACMIHAFLGITMK